LDLKRASISLHDSGLSKYSEPVYRERLYSMNRKTQLSKSSCFHTARRVPTSPNGNSFSYSRAAVVHCGGQLRAPVLLVITGWSRSFIWFVGPQLLRGQFQVLVSKKAGFPSSIHRLANARAYSSASRDVGKKWLKFGYFIFSLSASFHITMSFGCHSCVTVTCQADAVILCPL
jgi:hypothetical protein